MACAKPTFANDMVHVNFTPKSFLSGPEVDWCALWLRLLARALAGSNQIKTWESHHCCCVEMCDPK